MAFVAQPMSEAHIQLGALAALQENSFWVAARLQSNGTGYVMHSSDHSVKAMVLWWGGTTVMDPETKSRWLQGY